MWIYGVKDQNGQDMPLEVHLFGPKKEPKEMTVDEAAKEKSKATKRKVAIAIGGAAAALGAVLFGVSKMNSNKQTPEISSEEDKQELLEANDDSDSDETVNEQETEEEL